MSEYERGLRAGGIVLGTRAKDEAHANDLSSYGAQRPVTVSDLEVNRRPSLGDGSPLSRRRRR